MRSKRRLWLLLGVGCVFVGCVAFLLLPVSAKLLTLDDPRPSDVSVVLAGDFYGSRYERGVSLLQSGVAPRMIVNVSSGFTFAGVTRSEWKDDFVAKTPSELRERISVCHIVGDSTDSETADVRRCLLSQNVRSVVLVTSAFHTRRALEVFSRRLPQYRWSVAAAPELPTVTMSERARTAAMEWSKLVWWHLARR